MPWPRLQDSNRRVSLEHYWENFGISDPILVAAVVKRPRRMGITHLLDHRPQLVTLYFN